MESDDSYYSDNYGFDSYEYSDEDQDIKENEDMDDSLKMQ